MLTVATVSALESVDVEAEPAVVRAPSSVGYGLAAAAAGLLLPTAFSSQVFSGFFTPKYLVLLLVAAIGFVPLLRLARSSRITWVARAAIGFLVVGLASALLSHAVNLGFFGLDNWGTGWLFWLGCAGAFALGARLRRDQLDWLLAGIVAGAVINALVAVYQVVTSPSGLLALYQGTRADGLLGNPIHLEALLLGGLALIARRASLSETRMVWWPVVLLFSVALELSLERAGLVVMLVVVVVSLVAYGVRRAAPFGALTLVGYGIGYLTGGSGLARVASGTSDATFATRLNIWDFALRSVAHHPFLGVGPGEVGSIIAPLVSESMARRLGVGSLPLDSHDFLIEVLATTGVLGFLAFVSWLGGAGLKARGPFLGCAVAMLAIELIEPLNLGVTPVALLALGAATAAATGQPTGLAALRKWRYGTPTAAGAAVAVGDGSPTEVHEAAEVDGKSPWAQPATLLTAILVAVALFIGITMVIGDHYLLDSYNAVPPTQKIATAVRANEYIPYWPDPPLAIAQGYLLRSDLTAPNAAAQALPWELAAAARDASDPVVRSDIGTVELQLGNLPAARQQFLESLKLDPWTFQSLEALGTIAKDEHDLSTSLYWYRRAELIAPPSQDLGNLIRSVEKQLQSSGR
jgi:O-antigen ligase